MLEKPLSNSTIVPGLKIYINDFPIPKALAALMGQALLVNRSTQVMLFAVYFTKTSSRKNVSPKPLWLFFKRRL